MENDAPVSSHDDTTAEEPIDVEAIMRAVIEEHDHTLPEEPPQTEDTLSDGDSR